MNQRPSVALLAALIFLESPRFASAGMPSISLSDMAAARIQTISFFLACLLLSSWALQRIWNGLTGDFPRLLRLSYRRALGVISLWGMLFLLILTMISGARELLTPEAWHKEGLTYKLNTATEAPKASTMDIQRQERLRALWVWLIHYAQTHGGQFPPDDQVYGIPEQVWSIPDPSGLRYVYRGGQAPGQDLAPLAIEPDVFERGRLALFTDGTVARISPSNLPVISRPENR
ncbi:hypothetical protein ACYOEI_13475 [Singulisphaera rosea]